MLPVNETASWKKFFVFVAGKTNDAHQTIVGKFQGCGHIQVEDPEDCDYCLVFCPITSRVGTDIEEALEQCPGGKPIILVVMHHTFDCDHHTGESRRQVQNLNVDLTVDCLFHEGKLLKCNRNNIAWIEIERLFGFPQKTKWTDGEKTFACVVVAVVATAVLGAAMYWIYLTIKP